VTNTRGTEQSHIGTHGPDWQDELLNRLRNDSRFAQQLRGTVGWGDIPPGKLIENTCRSGPAQSSLCYFTSSSTGTPKQVAFSGRDWQQIVAHRADCLAELGLGKDHLAAVVLPYGPWFSGDNLSEALLHLGAGVLPAGMYSPHLPGVTRLMTSVGVNALITTPSIARNMMRFPLPCQMDKLVLVGEAVSSSIRKQLAAHFGAVPQCLYAASEAVLGAEVRGKPGVFHWDPDRLHLEVLTPEGVITEAGTGELLVTRRYGEAMPLLRYPLNDRVELSPDTAGGPHFKYLGRCGHGFGLASGVKVARAQLDRFLDEIPSPVHEAHFAVEHTQEGDRLHIILGGSTPLPEPADVSRRFLTSSLDVADAHRSGFLTVSTEIRNAPVRAKRRLKITETPWRL